MFFSNLSSNLKSKSQSEYFPNCKVIAEYAYTEDMNSRMTMEDEHFAFDDFFSDSKSALFGVLDGHNGEDVVKHCTKVMPEIFRKNYKDCLMKDLFRTVFQKTDDQLKLVGASDSGACVCISFITQEPPNKVCYMANVGDTRAVLCRNNEAIRLSYDHKASNEQEATRVKNAGGVILKNRVLGTLAVTRTLGDLELKSGGVSCDPYVNKVTLDKFDKFIIIASDGLWDVIEDQKAVDLVKDAKNSEEMSKLLVNFAINNGSRDNVSVLIIKL